MTSHIWINNGEHWYFNCQGWKVLLFIFLSTYLGLNAKSLRKLLETWQDVCITQMPFPYPLATNSIKSKISINLIKRYNVKLLSVFLKYFYYFWKIMCKHFFETSHNSWNNIHMEVLLKCQESTKFRPDENKWFCSKTSTLWLNFRTF